MKMEVMKTINFYQIDQVVGKYSCRVKFDIWGVLYFSVILCVDIYSRFQ
jgi:hypothetical protein